MGFKRKAKLAAKGKVKGKEAASTSQTGIRIVEHHVCRFCGEVTTTEENMFRHICGVCCVRVIMSRMVTDDIVVTGADKNPLPIRSERFEEFIENGIVHQVLQTNAMSFDNFQETVQVKTAIPPSFQRFWMKRQDNGGSFYITLSMIEKQDFWSFLKNNKGVKLFMETISMRECEVSILVGELPVDVGSDYSILPITSNIFDQYTNDQYNIIRFLTKMSFLQFQKMVETKTTIPVHGQRFWMRRDNERGPFYQILSKDEKLDFWNLLQRDGGVKLFVHNEEIYFEEYCTVYVLKKIAYDHMVIDVDILHNPLQIASEYFVDYIDNLSSHLIRHKKEWPFIKFQNNVEEKTGIPASFQRFWIKKQDNGGSVYRTLSMFEKQNFWSLLTQDSGVQLGVKLFMEVLQFYNKTVFMRICEVSTLGREFTRLVVLDDENNLLPVPSKSFEKLLDGPSHNICYTNEMTFPQFQNIVAEKCQIPACSQRFWIKREKNLGSVYETLCKVDQENFWGLLQRDKRVKLFVENEKIILMGA